MAAGRENKQPRPPVRENGRRLLCSITIQKPAPECQSRTSRTSCGGPGRQYGRPEPVVSASSALRVSGPYTPGGSVLTETHRWNSRTARSTLSV